MHKLNTDSSVRIFTSGEPNAGSNERTGFRKNQHSRHSEKKPNSHCKNSKLLGSEFPFSPETQPSSVKEEEIVVIADGDIDDVVIRHDEIKGGANDTEISGKKDALKRKGQEHEPKEHHGKTLRLTEQGDITESSSGSSRKNENAKSITVWRDEKTGGTWNHNNAHHLYTDRQTELKEQDKTQQKTFYSPSESNINLLDLADENFHFHDQSKDPNRKRKLVSHKPEVPEVYTSQDVTMIENFVLEKETKPLNGGEWQKSQQNLPQKINESESKKNMRIFNFLNINTNHTATNINNRSFHNEEILPENTQSDRKSSQDLPQTKGQFYYPEAPDKNFDPTTQTLELSQEETVLLGDFWDSNENGTVLQDGPRSGEYQCNQCDETF